MAQPGGIAETLILIGGLSQTVARKPLLRRAKWVGFGLIVAGLAALVFGVLAVEDSGCGHYVGDVSQPACQWAIPPGVLVFVGADVLIFGIVAMMIGVRAKAV